jgi:hypothetical protein
LRVWPADLVVESLNTTLEHAKETLSALRTQQRVVDTRIADFLLGIVAASRGHHHRQHHHGPALGFLESVKVGLCGGGGDGMAEAAGRLVGMRQRIRKYDAYAGTLEGFLQEMAVLSAEAQQSIARGKKRLSKAARRPGEHERGKANILLLFGQFGFDAERMGIHVGRAAAELWTHWKLAKERWEGGGPFKHDYGEGPGKKQWA